jgi:hypothetical protein
MKLIPETTYVEILPRESRRNSINEEHNLMSTLYNTGSSVKNIYFPSETVSRFIADTPTPRTTHGFSHNLMLCRSCDTVTDTVDTICLLRCSFFWKANDGFMGLDGTGWNEWNRRDS